MKQHLERSALHSNWATEMLRWINLRPEEVERTALMFVFYTLTSVGMLWLEVSVAALFLGEYGAESLPWIYIVSAGIGAGLGGVYSWIQRRLPLQHVLVGAAVLMALPLFLFWFQLQPIWIGGYTVFLMRLWFEAIYVLNELNTSITANQLFTIREIKRTYPLISSGILAADVLSGVSLPLLRAWVGLENVVVLSGVMLLMGAGILLYLTRGYRQFFPDVARWRSRDQKQAFANRRLQKPQRHYVVLLLVFFIMVQVLILLLDFQYLNQLEQGMSVDRIADFIALFSAILGLFELTTQWFVSGRVIERLGIFKITAIAPILLISLSLLTLTGILTVFVGVIALKFVDELLRYTLVASTNPVLFQPIPDTSRGHIQSLVRGVAEPLSVGVTGLVMLGTIVLLPRLSPHPAASEANQTTVFLIYTGIASLVWLLSVLQLRVDYLKVLVMSSDRGQLSTSNVDSAVIRRNVVEQLDRATNDDDRTFCVDLLMDYDPEHAGDVLAPRLLTFSPSLQRRSLQAMLVHPNPVHLRQVRRLVRQPLPSDLLALALRYLWLATSELNIPQIRTYLRPTVDPAMRSVAAAVLLQRGTPQQKAEATDILRRMLTHSQERERLMGCRALESSMYLQSLRLYIKPLLQDESLRVRCTTLEVIAATHLDEYYPALLRGLRYRSTREAARRGLVRLGDEVLPLLQELATDRDQMETVRIQAWITIGLIDTPAAVQQLIDCLPIVWGDTRRTVLCSLLRVPYGRGIDAVADQLGRLGVEALIRQELDYLAQLYAGRLDLQPEGPEDESLATSPATVPTTAAEAMRLLQQSLRDAETDTVERLFLLLRLLYDTHRSSKYEKGTIQAAALNLQSDSRDSIARGLEILDNTINLSCKAVLLQVLDRQPDREKLRALADFLSWDYQPMSPSQRLRQLFTLPHCLPDWTLACGLHLAYQQQWWLAAEQVLTCLRHPTGFVREAALTYLQLSPRSLQDILPYLKDDPDHLVSAQVKHLLTSG